MRLIREQVIGEISATTYKRLVKTLKPLNKRQLWAILDHYLFHVITDQHADELLQHLQQMQQDAAGQPVDIAAATEEEIADRMSELTYRPKFDGSISVEALEANKDRLPMLFDESYFTNYIHPAARADAAQKLVAYSKSHELPVEDHWVALCGEDK